jgi:hypothetical protein
MHGLYFSVVPLVVVANLVESMNFVFRLLSLLCGLLFLSSPTWKSRFAELLSIAKDRRCPSFSIAMIVRMLLCLKKSDLFVEALDTFGNILELPHRFMAIIFKKRILRFHLSNDSLALL